MTERLLVKEAFGDFEPGDRITDARTMKRVTASHPEYVLREAVDDEPAGPEPEVDPVPVEPAKKVADKKAPAVTRHTIND